MLPRIAIETNVISNYLWLLDFPVQLIYLMGSSVLFVRLTIRPDLLSKSLFSFAGASVVGGGPAFPSGRGRSLRRAAASAHLVGTKGLLHAKSTSSLRLHVDRVARRHRHYRSVNRIVAARGPVGREARAPPSVRQQPQADRPGPPQLPDAPPAGSRWGTPRSRSTQGTTSRHGWAGAPMP